MRTQRRPVLVELSRLYLMNGFRLFSVGEYIICSLGRRETGQGLHFLSGPSGQAEFHTYIKIMYYIMFLLGFAYVQNRG